MATTHYLALEDVSCVLPDGTPLFVHLTETFDDQRRTGLVGRNGSGKTMLARVLAGLLPPSSGRCVRAATVHYLAQQVGVPAPGSTVADLAGVQAAMAALRRIEAGSTDPADFDTVGERWHIRLQLQQALEQHGLGHLQADTPAARLSGGETMRVALIGALLAEADFLILDEPSNHLDQPSRTALIDQLARWPRGLLVISHDRQLLDTMDRIVELAPLGLRSYGGNYTFYAQAKAHEQESAVAELERARLDRRREEQAMRAQRERQEKRQARGARTGQQANQAKILLDRQKGAQRPFHRQAAAPAGGTATGLGATRVRSGGTSGRRGGHPPACVALACALYADPPPPLLLLDEPSNHLDLPSLRALEALLASYQGAMLVASHDPVFLGALGLTDRLEATGEGWRLYAVD